MSADCVFCKIRDGQIPSMKIYDDERTLVFMDINPLNAGHCLVVTKTHAPTIWESSEADLQAAITVAKKVAVALRQTLKPDGLNLLQANGAAAFQSVPLAVA
jgi:histidine triad (HIT) family protein